MTENRKPKTENQKPKAEFSVIIASVNGLPILGECLAAIERAAKGFAVETVVVDATDAATAAYVAAHFPRVKFIRLEARPGIPRMRARAIDEAEGEYCVVIEDHCIVPEDWFAALRRAHERGYAVVGGAVENGATERLIDWAVFLCEYSSLMPPIAAGESEFVAGNNVSYRRDALAVVDEATRRDCWEYFLQTEMRRRGVKFFASPEVVVSHRKEFGFRYFLAQRYHYSRSFAAMRRARAGFGQQLFYLAYAPVAPAHLVWRVARHVRAKRRNRRELILTLPLLAVFMLAYAAGELAGQLFGAGRSLAQVE